MSNDTRRGWFGRRESDEPRGATQDSSQSSVDDGAPLGDSVAKPAYSDLDAEFRAAATAESDSEAPAGDVENTASEVISAPEPDPVATDAASDEAFHVKPTASALLEDTPLAREVADLTRRRQALT